ncbi:hypothetical protein H0H87_010954 [Tephrocybe sp. NHM501043]|nr:hypothetical protein H0H87_010954 [Tephrocybe sp. NHM501043]
MSSPSLKEFSELRASVTSLTEIMKKMALRIAPSPVPSTPSPVITPVVPPVSLTNAHSASLHSLRSYFPDIEAVVIVASITHEFKATYLHKLDPTK